MKLRIILSMILLIISTASADNSYIPITITKIYDGDTVQAEVEGEVFLVRLKGVDCYETMRISRAYRQAYEGGISVDEVVERGERSKEYLSGLFNQVGKDRIYFQFQGVNRYSRALGVLYFNKMNVNKEMINKGGCLVYEYKQQDKRRK